MAEIEWAILCDYAFLDAGRKSCLIGVFDRIFTPRVPATHHQAALALKLIGDATEKVALKIEITRPQGGVLVTLGAETQLTDSGTVELQINMAGLQLPDFGLYAFNIYLGDQLAKSVGVTVSTPPQPPPTPT
jgi:hypothetical protein